MEIKIQAVHFDATEKLEEYVEKKVAKLAKYAGETADASVHMQVVKPQTAMNKEVAVSVHVPGNTLRVEKICDTFEEAVDQCVDAMKVQLEKYKEKNRG